MAACCLTTSHADLEALRAHEVVATTTNDSDDNIGDEKYQNNNSTVITHVIRTGTTRQLFPAQDEAPFGSRLSIPIQACRRTWLVLD